MSVYRPVIPKNISLKAYFIKKNAEKHCIRPNVVPSNGYKNVPHVTHTAVPHLAAGTVI
jgi:hypothetical protein